VTENVKEYVSKRQKIENEIKLLRLDLRDLDVEYKEKIDVKAVKAAIRIVKIREVSDEAVVDNVIDILSSLE
jgi:uncharacterized protein (UPF0335 family)